MAESVASSKALQALFRPTNRLRERYYTRDRLDETSEGKLAAIELIEVELLVTSASCSSGVSCLNDLLTSSSSAVEAVTWDSFCETFSDTAILWMNDSQFLYIARDKNSCSPRPTTGSCRWILSIKCNGWRVTVHAPQSEPAADTCDFLLSLLACSSPEQVSLSCVMERAPFSGASLVRLLAVESLQCLEYKTCLLDVEQCQALSTASRDTLEIKLVQCGLAENAGPAFVECVQSGAGPTQLYRCYMDFIILAAVLNGNRRLRLLKLCSYRLESIDHAELQGLFQALGQNLGLEHLDLSPLGLFDFSCFETLCQSLAEHTTLIRLDLRRSGGGDHAVLTNQQVTERTQAMAAALQTNTVLHTIHWSERDELIHAREIQPRLDINKCRPCVSQIVRIRSDQQRRQILGLALAKVQHNPDLIWMLLIPNVDVVCPLLRVESSAGKRKRK